jgi:spore coat polysaccharide biosynthesis predicted glycosyltransferase SpsG
VRVVVGPGVPTADLPTELEVIQVVENMAEEMTGADVIVTSAGRTVYEAAATGTPVVVIAQNAREATHSHISLDAGVIFAGIGPLVDEIQVLHIVERLLDDYGLRNELSRRLRGTVDGKGARRIAGRIQQMLEGLV